MAQQPSLVNGALTNQELVEKYEKVLRPEIENEMAKQTNRYSHLTIHFQEYSMLRKQNFFKQIKFCFLRHMTHLIRNPKMIRAHIFISVFTSLLTMIIFYHFANFPDIF